MASAFQYRPKFVDIRVNPPERPDAPRDPDERRCDQTGCGRAGLHRAPKARDRTDDYWYFCREHAADYNARWNYFAGMSETEFAAYQQASETGHRPTWTFRAAKNDQLSAAFRNFQVGRRTDAFGLFRGGRSRPEAPRRRSLTRLQALALEALSLEEGADAAQIRVRYAELVKRYHPDANGGDRACEAQLERVIRAYQTLKASGLA